MKRECDIKNPLVRDGTSQAQRLLRALQPEYVKVDERSMADLLCFAHRYAQILQYYDLNNTPDGNWKAFIEHDISTVIALISGKDLNLIKRCFDGLNQIFDNPAASTDDLKGALKTLFDLIFTLASETNDWYGDAVEGLQLKRELHRIITAQLRTQLQQAIGYYKCATDTSSIFTPSDTVAIDECEDGLQQAQDVLSRPFHTLWMSDGASTWQEYVNSIHLDCSGLGDMKTVANQIIPIFEAFFNAQAQIIHQAPDYLQETIEKWPNHEPHLALFLVFLQLFRYTQDHLNTITQRHLDFYYKDVLQFQEKEEIPDRVHVIFELAKQVHSYLLKAGTLLKAGKDATGENVVYQLDQDTTINKAKVEELKTVFIDHEDSGRIYDAPVANSQDGLGGEFDTDEPKWKTFGESQRVTDHPTKYRSETQRTMQFSRIGFAIASPTLFLAEGTRTIWITLFTNSLSGITKNNLQGAFIAYLSGEESWIEQHPTVESVNTTLKTIKLRITLPVETPPVAGYNSEVLGDTLDTTFPVLKIVLVNTPDQKYLYHKLNGLTLSKIELKVEVEGVKQLIVQNETGVLDVTKPFYPFGTTPTISSTFYVGSAEIFQKALDEFTLTFAWKDVPDEDLGNYYANYSSSKFVITKQTLRDLASIGVPESALETVTDTLQDLVGKEFRGKDEFWVAIEKAFITSPFPGTEEGISLAGIQKQGASGKRDRTSTKGELESSEVASLLVKLARVGINNSSFQVRYSLLIDRDWKTISSKETLFNIANAKDDRQVVLQDLPDSEVEVLDEPLTAFTHDTRRGFMKVELTSPDMAFGHRLFRDIHPKRIIAYATDPENSEKEKNIPNEPYTPLINSLTVDYTAKEVLDFEQHISKFYHIYPFGHKEVQANLEPSRYLFPQFEYKGTQSEGELYIGISGLVPRQNLSLLFQVAEGSADPEFPKQMVNWSYLSQNQWQPFQSYEILSDSTNGLITSGIITFDIPKAANTDNTLFPAGQHWLRASVEKHSGAICDLIAIQAQVAQASFVNKNNDPLFMAQSLPAGTISKLQVKQAAIKAVSQPYASFGGKIQEQSDHLYTRVSERLRHKGRGITIWDYEKLVLEQFPSIYKVKCINHSTYHFERDGLTIPQSEFAPGFVSLIVIPNLRNKNAVNPLEPRASLATLDEIKTYVSTLISPFAARNLRVINPFYEKIEVVFSVQFHLGHDWGVHREQLNEDLKRFLSPWAFEEGQDILFGGRIHRSVILNFVEERPYVDFVTDFQINHVEVKNDVDEVIPTTARSILVSHHTHTINEVTNCP